MNDPLTRALSRRVTGPSLRATGAGTSAVTEASSGPSLSAGWQESRLWRLLIEAALLAVVYFVAGKLGLLLGLLHPSASAVWAPTGISLAALLILGYRVLPGIFAGAFLPNAAPAGSLATSLGIATGNTLEAVIGAALVNRFANGRNAFERPKDAPRFAPLAGGMSPAP